MKIFMKISTAFAVLISVLFLFCGAARPDGYLILVNRAHPLPDGYIPPNLTELKSTRADGRAVQLMQKEAAVSLDAMISELTAEFAGKGESASVSVTSAYRSRDYQRALFEGRVSELISEGMSRDSAVISARRFVAEPGKSEHETGLAADLHNLSCASQSFADTKEYLWLCENACRFGFILRYPKDKEKVTGIAFEPWHWRYVGKAAARQIARSGICLEEYPDIMLSFR